MSLIKNKKEKRIFFMTLFYGIILNFSLYIYMPYVMDVFYNLNENYEPILISNGRYIRLILDNIVSFLFKPFLVPYFSLIVSTIIYSYSFVILYRYLNIDNENFDNFYPLCIILPCFTILNPFYHDLIYYSLNFLLSIISAYIIVNFRNNIKYVLFLIMNLIILFIYQLNFFFIVPLLLIDLIRRLLDNEDIKSIIKKGIIYFINLFLSVLIYFLIFKILHLSMGTRDAQFSLFNLFKTYASFLILPFRDYMQLNEILITKIAILFIYLIILYLLINIIISNKYKLIQKVIFILIIAIFPIGMNCVLLILKNPSRAMFAEMFFVIAPYFLMKYVDNNKNNLIVKNILCLSLIILFISNFYTANARYLELKNRSDAEKSYCIELVSAIRNTEGYSTDCKLAIITKNQGNLEDSYLNDYFEDYSHERFGAEYASSILRFNYGEGLYKALNYYSAFRFEKATDDEINYLKNNVEVINMDLYPNFGSIKRVNNFIVVKFTE